MIGVVEVFGEADSSWAPGARATWRQVQPDGVVHVFFPDAQRLWLAALQALRATVLRFGPLSSNFSWPQPLFTDQRQPAFRTLRRAHPGLGPERFAPSEDLPSQGPQGASRALALRASSRALRTRPLAMRAVVSHDMKACARPFPSGQIVAVPPSVEHPGPAAMESCGSTGYFSRWTWRWTPRFVACGGSWKAGSEAVDDDDFLSVSF